MRPFILWIDLWRGNAYRFKSVEFYTSYLKGGALKFPHPSTYPFFQNKTLSAINGLNLEAEVWGFYLFRGLMIIFTARKEIHP